MQSTEEEGRFDEDDLRLLTTIAAHVGVALQNAEAYRKLNTALDHLRATQEQLVQQEKLASLGALTAGIAHEIKNPLNFVNNFAQLCGELADELDAVRDKQVAEVEAELQEILADLKINAAKINAQVSDFNATIERSYDEAVGRVVLVPQEMGRVFINLLNNAFYAVHERAKKVNGPFAPTVSVSTQRVGDHVKIHVRDNGLGIPKEVREKIFDPFFTTKPTGSGTGLGLSLAYDIVTQGHGGTLMVESKDGEGATFMVTLPANQTEVASST